MSELSKQLWRNIMNIRTDSDDEDFVRYILEARSDYLALRLKQEPAIRQIYVDAAANVAQDIARLAPGASDLTRNHLRALEKSLTREAENIRRALEGRLRSDLQQATGLGGRSLQAHMTSCLQSAGLRLDMVRVQRGFGDVNTAAVEAIWARTRNGMKLSDRIWQTSDNARDNMRSIILDGVARGRDSVQVARDLEQYVKHGAATMAGDYPGMMARIGKRAPKDLCYEAFRLARSEMSMAFMEGMYAAGRVNPAYKGVRWLLSSSHPLPDVCDDLASADLYGLGAGCYPAGDEPPYPHPNCLCTVAPLVEDTKEFVERLKNWRDDPSSDQELEQWYNNIYQEKAAEKQNRLTQDIKELETGLEEEETTSSFPSVPKKTLERAMHDSDYISQQLNASHGDIVLQDMAKEVGFHKKPTLLSKEEMDAYIQQGNRELFRGIGGRQGEAETYVEQFKTGEYFAGKGVYGNGVYTAYGEDGMEVAKQFAGGVEKNVLRMALKEYAKIILYDALIEMQKLEFTALQEEERALRRKARREADRIYDETEDDDKVEEFLKEAAKKWEEMEKYRQVLADLGRYALYKGYDAIDIPSSRFMVVLNRGKVFVQK